MLELNPSSVKTLRSYAQFLVTLYNKGVKSQEYLVSANRLEDNERRQRMHPVKNVVFGSSTKSASFLSDNAALITISGSSFNLGEIMDASTAACRLFGYSRSSFVGQNIRTIVPPPLKMQHDGMLLRFRHKRKSNVVGN